jgi:hypothetical protein
MQKLLKSKKSLYFLYFVAACLLTSFLYTFYSEPINGDLGLLLELVLPSKEPVELPQQEPTCWQLTQENIKKRKAEAARLELIQENIYRKEAEDACRQINQENMRRKEAGEELKLYPTITKEIIPHLKRVQYPSEFIVKLPEGVYTSSLKPISFTKFEDLHTCELPTIAGVNYVMAEDYEFFERLFKGGSETKKTELIHTAETAKSAPEKGGINVFTADAPAEVVKYVPDFETCSSLSSLKIKDEAVSSPLFK